MSRIQYNGYAWDLCFYDCQRNGQVSNWFQIIGRHLPGHQILKHTYPTPPFPLCWLEFKSIPIHVILFYILNFKGLTNKNLNKWWFFSNLSVYKSPKLENSCPFQIITTVLCGVGTRILKFHWLLSWEKTKFNLLRVFCTYCELTWQH